MIERVTLVCMGNICRSPMAEAVLRHKLAEAGLGDAVQVDSAGTGGWHAGDPADPRAQAALEARGYRLRHRARRFSAVEFRDGTLVVALDGQNLADLRALAPDALLASSVRLLRSFDPDAPEGAGVPDPYYGGDSDFARALDLVEAACDGLVERLLAGDLRA